MSHFWFTQYVTKHHYWTTVNVSFYTYNIDIQRVCMRDLTFGSCAEAGVVWGESMLAGGGKVRKLASRGERTISFCLYRRWWRSLHTQASNTSGDFTYTHRGQWRDRQRMSPIICLSGSAACLVSEYTHNTILSNTITLSSPSQPLTLRW